MKVYLIMPVRNANPYWMRIADLHREALEAQGDEVHYPPRDAPQDCPTGRAICEAHRSAMLEADEVHVLWDVESKGSHFDLGMAYALGKTIRPIGITAPDSATKSYWKAVIAAGDDWLSEAAAEVDRVHKEHAEMIDGYEAKLAEYERRIEELTEALELNPKDKHWIEGYRQGAADSAGEEHGSNN